MSEFKSIKAIIQRKSHFFGLYQSISNIYFDTEGYYSQLREASLTSGWKVHRIDLTSSILITNSENKKELIAHINLEHPPYYDIIVYKYSVKGLSNSCLYIYRRSDKSYEIYFQSDILDYDDVIDIAYQLLLIRLNE